ncbi:hypothetical protein NLG97_g6724 [Lecanicillium saksenae]|uniref:Uncharacterized protein n=1 Tax=Lecanicillium saksenae TaxID=468837 RepID=A0ACC1QQI2_9HYPO|nr:hypothetical protein NLG97_g6724 [Lecanicillium saksenae]
MGAQVMQASSQLGMERRTRRDFRLGRLKRTWAKRRRDGGVRSGSESGGSTLSLALSTESRLGKTTNRPTTPGKTGPTNGEAEGVPPGVNAIVAAAGEVDLE